MFTIEYILKNKRIYIAFLITIIFICILHIAVEGSLQDRVQFHSLTAKAYCLDGITADGSPPHIGICGANPEWIGLTAAMYLEKDGELGDFIGYFEIKDASNNPDEINIWLPTKSDCKHFGKKKVLVALVKGVG